MFAEPAPEPTDLREEVRAFLAAHAAEAPPRRAADRGAPAAVAARRAWQARLAGAGLLGVAWPPDCGGRGLDPADQLVVDRELDLAGVPGAFDVVGIGMVAPAIIAHGSPEQRARHLPPLLHGDEVWCQLFSEPGAGSDLAGIATRGHAQRDGTWRVSGQKVWTSNAGHAAFGLMLVRTDPEQPKHKGLTMFVVPMAARGVTVRPLRQLSGEARFSEVFLDDVVLAAGAVVGGVGGGWRVALDTLGFERVAIGRTADSLTWTAEDFAAALAADPAVAADPVVSRDFGEIAAELLAVRAAGEQALEAATAGEPPGPPAALIKVSAVRALTRAGDLVADALGPDALAVRSGWGRLISDLPGLRSAGGSEEIVYTMVGERALGLPPEPRVDRDVPFSALGPEP